MLAILEGYGTQRRWRKGVDMVLGTLHSVPPAASQPAWPDQHAARRSPHRKCSDHPQSFYQMRPASFPCPTPLEITQRFKIWCRCLSPSSRCDAVAAATGKRRRKKTREVGGRPKAREGTVTLATSTTLQGMSINASVCPELRHNPPPRKVGEIQLDQ